MPGSSFEHASNDRIVPRYRDDHDYHDHHDLCHLLHHHDHDYATQALATDGRMVAEEKPNQLRL